MFISLQKKMIRDYFKYMVIGLAFVYCTYRITEIDSFYKYFNKTDDVFVFIALLVSCVIYKCLKINSYLTLKKLNGCYIDKPIEYKIISSNDCKTMKKMLARPIDWFFWYEIDYPYTIEKDCNIGDAINFMNTHSTVGQLTNTMRDKMLYVNNNTSHSLMMTNNVIMAFVIAGFVTLFGIVYFVYSHDHPTKNRFYQTEYYHSDF